MWTHLPSSGVWETTAFSFPFLRAALMASRSSSDSAGEQLLEMDSWNEERKIGSTAGNREQNKQIRVVEARVEGSCMARQYCGLRTLLILLCVVSLHSCLSHLGFVGTVNPETGLLSVKSSFIWI